MFSQCPKSCRLYLWANSFLTEMQFFSVQLDFHSENKIHRCLSRIFLKLLKNNYFAEQLLMAITLHGLSSLCTYIVLLGQKLLWVESFTIFVNFELIRESLWRWKFSLGWFAKVYLRKFFYEVKNYLNEAKVLNWEQTRKND